MCTAATGIQALQAFAEARPDLVLLDVMLPELDGFQVCRQIRERSAVPVIFVTAKELLADKLLAC